MITAAAAPDIAIPRTRDAVFIERLFWVFAMSLAFDYRGETGAGGGLAQALFLATCTFSTAAIVWLGRRFLAVRPGALLIGFWVLFLGFMAANSLAQGVPPGRSIRVILPLVLCLFGLTNTHIAACAGIAPSRIVLPLFAMACINVPWRIVQGFLFKAATVETVRFDVQSPASNWLAAWIGCAILLRGSFRPSLLLACGALFLGVFVTVTRSLAFPMLASALACTLCYLLGVRWGIYQWAKLPRRLIPVGAAAGLVLLALGAAAVIEPVLIERWNERLFHHAESRNIGGDISLLTRQAEATAIWDIMRENPVHFIHGHGVGCSYYWDPSFLPEIYQVIPAEDAEMNDIWFAGHSVWTYSLLSGGAIALVSMLVLFIWVAASSLAAARANATDPGPDQWLAFLPFVATACLISETLTANPFQERLAGLIFGVMAGLPQAFMVRASWLHTAGRQEIRRPS